MSGGLLQIHDPLKPKGQAVGIDLGTTNSLVAAVVNGVPRCLPVDEQGGTLLPSVVHYATEGGVVVGARARAQAATPRRRSSGPTASPRAWATSSASR
jgi:molecular chaperone HscA